MKTQDSNTALRVAMGLLQEASQLIASLPHDLLSASSLFRHPLIDELDGAAIMCRDAADKLSEDPNTNCPPSRLNEALSLLAEVSQCFTRDDDLPGDLLGRIDVVLNAQCPDDPLHVEG